MRLQSCQEVETQEDPSLSPRRVSFHHWGEVLPHPPITGEMRLWPGNGAPCIILPPAKPPTNTAHS